MAWSWNSSPINLRDRLFPKHLARVEPTLQSPQDIQEGVIFRSGQIAAGLIEETLKDLEIQMVVDLTHNRGDRDADQVAERNAVQQLGIEHENYPLSGSGRGSISTYTEAVAAIARGARSGKRVLVHCRAGDRRTGGVLATYKLLVERASSAEARIELERFSRRSPDESGLVEFLDDHMPEIAAGLLESGVIQEIPRPLPRLADSAEFARDSAAPQKLRRVAPETSHPVSSPVDGAAGRKAADPA